MTSNLNNICENLKEDLIFMRDNLVDEIDDDTKFNYFARTIDKALFLIESVKTTMTKQ